jgi:hypothetical protein
MGRYDPGPEPGKATGNKMSRYRLRDDGYPFRKIMDGKTWIGRVDTNADGSFTAGIRGFSASGSSWEDAFNAVVAAVKGIAVSELTDALISINKSQQHSQTILAWLTNNAEANDGQLCFTNADLSHVIGWPSNNQAIGQLVSRLDFCCYSADLPAIGCAAEETFADAWAPKANHGFEFPKEVMVRRAKGHRWTEADFEKIGRESRALKIGARKAWDDEFASNAARIKKWAYAT